MKQQLIELHPLMTDTGNRQHLTVTLADEDIEAIEGLDNTKPVKIIFARTGHTLFSKALNKKIFNQLKKVYGDKDTVNKMTTWAIPEWAHRDRKVAAMFTDYDMVIYS